MNIFTKSLTAALASSVVVVGAGAFSPAYAQDTNTPPANAANPAATANAGTPPVAAATSIGSLADLPQDGDVSLTVHKFSNNGTPGPAGDGTELDSVADLGKPLPGATFTIERVDNINLRTQAGWIEAEKLAKGKEGAITPTLVEAEQVTTNDKGIAQFTGKKVGLYKVTETKAPEGHRATTAPFYVALPMTNTDGSGWLREVHVYPKNQKQSEFGTKTVNDSGTRVTHNLLRYTIVQPLEQRARTAPARKYYHIEDLYPADRVEQGKYFNQRNGASDVHVLGYMRNYHYNVVDDGKGSLKIVFTEVGLRKLDIESRQPDAKLTINVNLAVKGVDLTGPVINRYNYKEVFEDTPPNNPTPPDQPETLPDPPRFMPRQPTFPTPVEPAGDPVEPPTDVDPQWPVSWFGQVNIRKVNTSGTPLDGAEFALFDCDAKGNYNPEEYLWSEIIPTEDGVEIQQLRVNDWENNAPKDASNSFYCLVETKAPDNYELNAQPVRFQVLKGNQEETIGLTEVVFTDVERNAGGKLPLTGGKGILALILAGGIALLVGRGYSIYSQRRSS
ncbi:SpaH/EbpB family LPXTG-anchored major pilin [Corynebacterium lizhenjunii]|uniref:SpaH/EbpB family LPXTG-anchored major pilin n=1 Tax=Corynebacterium lizhenjunii TaxID=2709394 RepID=UPI0013EB2DB6|nr:SpaH/EbpB family LPXTG-anchored major pilin [Corynebacterium lizhenjunii]